MEISFKNSYILGERTDMFRYNFDIVLIYYDIDIYLAIDIFSVTQQQTSLVNYVLYVPYTRSCLTRLRALHALLKRLIYAPCAPFSSALRSLSVRLKIFLG